MVVPTGLGCYSFLKREGECPRSLVREVLGWLRAAQGGRKAASPPSVKLSPSGKPQRCVQPMSKLLEQNFPSRPELSPDKISVHGDGRRLFGRVRSVEGSKNVALPLVAASCLWPGVTVLSGIPRIRDVDIQIELMRCVGCHASTNGTVTSLSPAHTARTDIPAELTLRSRGAIYATCVPLCSAGRVTFIGIGGDALKGRSLEPHFRAFAGFGFEVVTSGGWITIWGALPEPRNSCSMTAQRALQQARLLFCWQQLPRAGASYTESARSPRSSRSLAFCLLAAF